MTHDQYQAIIVFLRHPPPEIKKPEDTACRQLPPVVQQQQLIAKLATLSMGAAQIAQLVLECMARSTAETNDTSSGGKRKQLALGHCLWLTTFAYAVTHKGRLPANTAQDVVWEGVLTNASADVLQCSFWKSLENRQNSVALILSKILPQRCQIREAGETTLSKFKTQPEFARAFCQWMDCGLFGLYVGSAEPSNQLSVRRQLEFFELTRDPSMAYTFHCWLLKRQDLLCTFLTRLYLIHLLPKQPALLDAVRRTFAWDRFVVICTTAMDRVRALINQFGWSVLFCEDAQECKQQETKKKSKRRRLDTQQSPVTEECLPPPIETVQEDNLNETASHHKLLACLNTVAQLWTKHGHTKMPKSAAQMFQLTRAFTKGEDDRLLATWTKDKSCVELQICVEAQQDMQAIFYHRLQDSFLTVVFASRNKVPPVSLRKLEGIDPSEMNEHGITNKHFIQLSACIERCIDYDEDAALELLQAFGADSDGFALLKSLKHSHESKKGKKHIVNGLLHMAIKYPYTYALVHTFAYLWDRHTSNRIFRLPLHYVENQIKAIRGRFGLHPTDPIPDVACWLKVCRVCDHIFSLTNTDKIVWKAVDSFGYNRIRQNLATGDEYCSRANVIAHAHLKDVQLTRIFILGQAVVWRKQLILLCPGPKCGIPFIYSNKCHYAAEYGFVCSACTAEMQGNTDVKYHGKTKRRSHKLKITNLVPVLR
jgi:hypothetical protein